ncbi:hypothetical protein GGX14DRAFT_523428 [Mycena pura]|uniref:Uncharacterized protein n=1 Tax=Mycena pura TaxID=153505 RepID=A0AAD6V675_9AGAR|nr:hypothetical protein GGX14DRAFT_523428 [Mycena pura]
MAAPQTFLRQRNTAGPAADTFDTEISDYAAKKRDEVVWGKTSCGEGQYRLRPRRNTPTDALTVFRVPTTHDVLTLFHPAYPKSHFDLLNLALLGAQLLLLAVLPRATARAFFLVYFAFWRAAYDAGLGWILTKQSKKTWIVREVQRRGWLDPQRRPATRAWVKKQLVGKMGSDYSFDELPFEYNTRLLFRRVVDVILLKCVECVFQRFTAIFIFYLQHMVSGKPSRSARQCGV